MLERIINFALYGDTDRKSYQTVKGKIEASNQITSLVFGSIAAVLITVMFILSFHQEGFSSSRPIYFFGAVFSLVIIFVSLAARRIPMLSYVAVYMAVSIFLLYGIAIAFFSRPEEQTVTFMVMLIFIPMIFVDRPVRMAVILVVFDLAFIIMAKMYKAKNVLSEDVTDAVIFGLLSLVSQTVINRTKIRGYVLENRLHIMSETDQLTGLNNRNCYESRLGLYPGMFRQSICCIYLDANGLHELNNNSGHQEGDRMLCSIAKLLQSTFGEKDTYRMGGDEFVAFVLDQSRKNIEEKIAEFRLAVENEGFHVSVGYAFSDSNKTEFNDMIVLAESKMYLDKAEYYKKHDRRQR